MVDYATELRIETIWRQLTPRSFGPGYWADLVWGRALPALLLSPFLVIKLLTAAGACLMLGPRASPAHWVTAINQVLFVVYFGLVIVLFAIRFKRGSGLRQPQVVAVAFFGSFAILLAPFLPAVPTRAYLEVPSILISCLGLAYTIWALAHLGRSFSILPEARRLVNSGPYALSRNPFYHGEAITGFSLLAPTAGPATMVLFLAFLAAQFLRIRWEERVLDREFGADFATYRSRVPRYLPGARRLRR